LSSGVYEGFYGDAVDFDGDVEHGYVTESWGVLAMALLGGGLEKREDGRCGELWDMKVEGAESG
jgi:hypothetical protein